MLRVCEVRCPQCGGAAREERAHFRCEQCGIVEGCCEGLHDPVVHDRAVIETTEELSTVPDLAPVTALLEIPDLSEVEESPLSQTG